MEIKVIGITYIILTIVQFYLLIIRKPKIVIGYRLSKIHNTSFEYEFKFNSEVYKINLNKRTSIKKQLRKYIERNFTELDKSFKLKKM